MKTPHTVALSGPPKGRPGWVAPVRLVSLALSVLMLAACGTEPEPPLAPELSAGLGTIGVTAAGAPPLLRVIPLPAGLLDGAANGAGAAVAGAINGCLEIDPTYLCALAALVATPWLAVGGAFYGLAAVKTEDDVREATRTIDEILAGELVRTVLADRVADRVGERVAAAARAEDIGSAPAPAAGRGFETILEIRVLKVRLGKRPAVNPSLPLRIEAQARLLRALDGKELYRRSFGYRGRKTLEYGGWAANGGEALRAELEAGYGHLAKRIAAAMLALPRD